MRQRTSQLLALVVEGVVNAVVEDADAVLPDVIRRLRTRSALESPEERAAKREDSVLRRVVLSLHKMMSHKGVQPPVRSTLAAVASSIPQPVFTNIVCGSATHRSSTAQLRNRNGVVRTHQGGLRRIQDRVGLGEYARVTARADRHRLEAGMAPLEVASTRFEPDVIQRCLAWLVRNADISSSKKRVVVTAGRRHLIASMMLRERVSKLFSRYTEAQQGATCLGHSTFRDIVDRLFVITKGRRSAMDYLSLTLGARNFDIMRDFVRRLGVTPERVQELMDLIDVTQQFLEIDFPDLAEVQAQQHARRCVGHCADLALSEQPAANAGVLCCHCNVVEEAAEAVTALAQSETDRADAAKMGQYVRLYQAHQLRGRVQLARCRQLRNRLPRNKAHLLLDFKMKWLPVRVTCHVLYVGSLAAYCLLSTWMFL